MRAAVSPAGTAVTQNVINNMAALCGGLPDMEVNDMKDKFIEYYTTCIQRAGSKELLEYLLKSDFLPRRPAQNIMGRMKAGW